MAKKLSDKSNYVSKRNIKSITVKRGNKTTEIDSKNLFDGAYVKKGVKFEDGGNFQKFLDENEENDNWYDNNWFYGQYKDNKFTFQVENERGDFVLEPMETTIYDIISRINKLKDGERAVFSNHESIERKQGNFIYDYGDGASGGERKILESKIKDIVIDAIRQDLVDYYQQMPIGSMYAKGGNMKEFLTYDEIRLNQKMTASEFKEFMETAEAGDTFQLFSPRHKDEQPYDCVVTRVRHKPEYKLISVTHKKLIGGAGVYNYKTDESAEENYAREFKEWHRDFPLRLRRRKKGMSKYAKGGSMYRNGGDVNNPSKKEMLDYLNMYFDYYDELRTIAIEEDNILTRKMLNSLDDEELEMAYDDAKYEIKADTYAKGGGVDVDDMKRIMYSWFNAWLGDYITDEELVNSLKRKLGKKWFRFSKDDTGANDWQSVENSVKSRQNREFLKEQMEYALEEKSLQIYSSKGEKMASGGMMANGGGVGSKPDSKTKIEINIDEEGGKIATRKLVKANSKGEKITYELTVGLQKSRKRGWFEVYATDEEDEEYFYSEGGLWIESGKIVDYDGVYELSEKLKPLMSALNLNSVDVYENGGMMAKGGGVGSKKDKAMKKLEKHIEYEFVNTDMGSGWAFSLDGFDLEMKYLDIFDASDLGIEEDWDDLSKEDKKYYYEDWKETLFESSYESFKDLAFKKYGYYYMENGGNMNDDKSYICTYEIGGL
jgi:hypothetical protein